MLKHFEPSEQKIKKKMSESTDETLVIDGFEILEEIGSGGFSRVHLAKHIDSGTYAAAKVVNLHAMHESEFNGIMREISVFMQTEHPNICSLYHLSVYKQNLYLFMECVPNGTLLNYVNQHHGLNEQEACQLFLQLFSALRYLHSVHFLVHRDLKLENVLIDGNNTIKLTDFGLAGTDYCNIMKTFVGTPGYTAPEVISGADYDQKCDVWSLGVCLFAMITGTLPFTAQNTNYRLLVDEATSMTFPGTFSPSLIDLFRKLFTVKPANRPSLMQLQSHPWLHGLKYCTYNVTPKPIVFYQVDSIEDIAKFKRRKIKPDAHILNACAEKGINPEQLTHDLDVGMVNANTAMYFCLLHPLVEKPDFSKPKQTFIPGNRVRSQSSGKKYATLRKLTQNPLANSNAVLKSTAKAVVTPQRRVPLRNSNGRIIP